MTDRPIPPAATSSDVARLAGVSRTTVSYVLNGTGSARISAATRARVREAALRLGYVPHAAARSLRAGRNRMVLMPSPSILVGPLLGEFFLQLHQGLAGLGYSIAGLGGPAPADDTDAARAWAELRPAAVFSLDGTGFSPEGVELLRRSGVGALVTFAPSPVPGVHTVLHDPTEVGTLAADHLLSRGCRRLGVVVPREPGLELFSRPRLQGVYATAAAAGAHAERLDLDYTEESARALAARWHELRLDGVFAYNDEYAMLLMRALQDAGVDVPARTALIGADDLLLGRLLRPRLSTVRLVLPDPHELAALIDLSVRGEAPSRVPEMGLMVVRREST
ncbi:LacI family DNA-binding transcriptional regulator [Streptomyces sp. NPDC051940]|uniref:LacI family DNA-binding transcriptional regulator n=1 Tax=Streptomyces sp. NPDC051940 TaxID=3155675 RepID=UPI00342914AD